MTNLILASTSPTRCKLLQDAGLMFRAIGPKVDERKLQNDHPEWSPHQLPAELAKAKASSLTSEHPSAVIIGADQTLVHNGKIYHKPKTLDEARHHLQKLRNETHQLITSAACVTGDHLTWTTTETVNLTMRNFSDAFLDDYITQEGESCLSSVGAYKIEGRGLQLFSRIDGDYFNILGLPLLSLLEHLRNIGIVRE